MISVPFAVIRELPYPKQLKKLGDHIKKKRLDRGLVQREVAAKLGIRANIVCQWELGHHEPKAYLIP